jgi:hypothetical protein
MDLFYGGEPRPIGRLSFDDRSGDFVEYSGPLDIALRTLFHFRKPFPPRIDPCYVKTPLPTQPTPLSSSVLGWMWGAGPLTGTGLDALVAGPNRPAPPKPPAAPRKPLITWGEAPAEPAAATAKSPTTPKRPAVRKQSAPTADSRERGDAYSELQTQLHRRNDYLDNLNESVNKAAESAQSYLNSARDTAFKESAKLGAKGMFTKML